MGCKSLLFPAKAGSWTRSSFFGGQERQLVATDDYELFRIE